MNFGGADQDFGVGPWRRLDLAHERPGVGFAGRIGPAGRSGDDGQGRGQDHRPAVSPYGCTLGEDDRLQCYRSPQSHSCLLRARRLPPRPSRGGLRNKEERSKEERNGTGRREVSGEQMRHGELGCGGLARSESGNAWRKEWANREDAQGPSSRAFSSRAFSSQVLSSRFSSGTPRAARPTGESSSRCRPLTFHVRGRRYRDCLPQPQPHGLPSPATASRIA